MSDSGGHDSKHVTVVGAGIIGAATAYMLMREGVSVTLIDRDEPGYGCSYGNAGAVSPGSVSPLSMPGMLPQIVGYLLNPDGPMRINLRYLPAVAPWLWRFLRAGRPDRVRAISQALHALQSRALDRHEWLLSEIGAPELLKRSGQLYVYPDARLMAKDAGSFSLRRANGVVVEDVGQDGIRELEPSIGPAYRCGVYLPNEGMMVNPFRLVQTITEAFRRGGGQIVRAEVRGLEVGSDGPTHLHTDAGPRPISRLVIAAGAWSHVFVRQLGHRVPLQNQRGYHIGLREPGISLSRPVQAADAKFFATPMETGLRLAGTVEFDSLEAPPNYARARLLIKQARRLFPDLTADHVSEEWMGQRPCLPDSLPVIGIAPRMPSVFFAFGHGHLGLTSSVVTADLIADLVAGRSPRIDLTPFDIGRFG